MVSYGYIDSLFLLYMDHDDDDTHLGWSGTSCLNTFILERGKLCEDQAEVR